MSVSAHNRKYKEEHNKVILDSFCLEKNDFLFIVDPIASPNTNSVSSMKSVN